MKAKELAQLFDTASLILKELPDMEIHTALSVVLQTLRSSAIPPSHPAISITIPNPIPSVAKTQSIDHEEGLVNQLENLPVETDLESFIRESSAWKNKSSLKALAAEIGLKVPSSYTKDQILNLLVTHYETRRTHAMIQS